MAVGFDEPVGIGRAAHYIFVTAATTRCVTGAALNPMPRFPVRLARRERARDRLRPHSSV